MMEDFLINMGSEIGGMILGALFVAFGGGCLFKIYCNHRRKMKHRTDPMRGRLV